MALLQIVVEALLDSRDKIQTNHSKALDKIEGLFYLPWRHRMQQSEISFSYKARYYKSGSPKTAKAIWIVLHGYGQLAQYFIRNFTSLVDQNICVIAPEALSRFYLEEVQSRIRSGNQRVGAAWMTRENRETDIENYLAFLNEIYHRELSDLTTPVTILGFSQGAATASRWVLDGKINFKRLILWAGIFPLDMNFESGKSILADKEVYLVYGKEDPFLNDDRFAEMKLLSEKLQITPRVIEFEGGHMINTETLSRLI
jgi:predicted esterase